MLPDVIEAAKACGCGACKNLLESVAAERERCAGIADAYARGSHALADHDGACAAEAIASEIRDGVSSS